MEKNILRGQFFSAERPSGGYVISELGELFRITLEDSSLLFEEKDGIPDGIFIEFETPVTKTGKWPWAYNPKRLTDQDGTKTRVPFTCSNCDKFGFTYFNETERDQGGKNTFCRHCKILLWIGFNGRTIHFIETLKKEKKNE